MIIRDKKITKRLDKIEKEIKQLKASSDYVMLTLLTLARMGMIDPEVLAAEVKKKEENSKYIRDFLEKNEK